MDESDIRELLEWDISFEQAFDSDIGGDSGAEDGLVSATSKPGTSSSAVLSRNSAVGRNHHNLDLPCSTGNGSPLETVRQSQLDDVNEQTDSLVNKAPHYLHLLLQEYTLVKELVRVQEVLVRSLIIPLTLTQIWFMTLI